MAYSDPVNTKILEFLNRAQTKIGEVSILIADKVSEDARYETFRDEAETAYGLLSFVRSLDNNFNDWTELEIVQFIDKWSAKANLNSVPYFDHDPFNQRLSFTPVITGPGSGTGSVTSFSSGNLSPLFTTSVATATTTPALSFAAVSQNANLVYAGPETGGAAAPTFRALVVDDFPLVSNSNWIFDNPSTLNAFLVGANSPFNTVGLIATDLAQLYAGTYGFNITNTGITLDLPSSVTGDIFTRGASTFLTRIPDVATGNVLISGGVGVVPSYGKVGLTTHVSGILPIANGGTGSSTQNFWALTGSSTLTGTASIVGGGTAHLVLGGSGGQGLVSLNSIITTDLHIITGDASDFLGQYSVVAASTKTMETTTSLSGSYDIGMRQGGDAGNGGFWTLSATGASVNKKFTVQGFDVNKFLLGSDASGDMWYQNASLNLTRIVAGAQNTVLTMGASSVPAWGQVSLTAGVTGILPPANGGTGVANNAASTLTISGNFATTFTVTGTTGLTLPTTGTLATLAGSETLTNKTLGSGTVFSVIPTINDGITFTFNPSATVEGINVGTVSAHPSAPTDGGLWYNSTNSTIIMRSGGNNKGVIGSMTGLVSNRVTLSGGSFVVTDSANLTFVTNRLLGTTLYLTLSAGTATAGTGPLIFTSSGTGLTGLLGTPVSGVVEFTTYGLWVTTTGAVRNKVLHGLVAAAAPATNAIGVIADYFGTSATRTLNTPNTWISVVGDDGNTYKIPGYS